MVVSSSDSFSLKYFGYFCHFIYPIHSRFIDVINESVVACLGIHILGTYLIAASWYNFLGEFVFVFKSFVIYEYLGDTWCSSFLHNLVFVFFLVIVI